MVWPGAKKSRNRSSARPACLGVISCVICMTFCLTLLSGLRISPSVARIVSQTFQSHLNPNLYISTSQLFQLSGGSTGVDNIRPRTVQVAVSPRIFYVRDLISPAEAAALVSEARHYVARSEVVNKDASLRRNAHRTSYGMFMSTPHQKSLAAPIAARISKLIGIPAENFEAMQILRYLPGQYYKPHPDAFNGEYVKDEQNRGGNRQATILFWLNAMEPWTGSAARGGPDHRAVADAAREPKQYSDKDFSRSVWSIMDASPCGGTTSFPVLNVTVVPRLGDGVLFHSMEENGLVNAGAMHSGDPLKPGCVKWLGVFWIRERKFPF